MKTTRTYEEVPGKPGFFQAWERSSLGPEADMDVRFSGRYHVPLEELEKYLEKDRARGRTVDLRPVATQGPRAGQYYGCLAKVHFSG